VTAVANRTNERPGTKAVLRSARMSASKARVVLDLVRGKDVSAADEILQFSERDAAQVVRKLLKSAVANAEHNDEQTADELFVSACFADEGRTLRRFRPRARGRATRIRKRTCHITVIVSRMDEDRLERRRAKDASRPGNRAARVAAQQAVESGRRRRRRRGGGTTEAADVAAAEDEQGIVDPQAAAVAAADASTSDQHGEDAEDAADAEDEMSEQDQGPAEAAEDAGIVDQQAAAAEEVEGVAGVSPEAEVAEPPPAVGDDDNDTDDESPS